MQDSGSESPWKFIQIKRFVYKIQTDGMLVVVIHAYNLACGRLRPAWATERDFVSKSNKKLTFQTDREEH